MEITYALMVCAALTGRCEVPPEQLYKFHDLKACQDTAAVIVKRSDAWGKMIAFCEPSNRTI